MIGHTVGAAGSFGALAALLAIHKGIVHPTINYSTVDPDCNIDCVPNKSRKQEIKIALKDSFAFGGNNTTVIFGRFREEGVRRG